LGTSINFVTALEVVEFDSFLYYSLNTKNKGEVVWAKKCLNLRDVIKERVVCQKKRKVEDFEASLFEGLISCGDEVIEVNGINVEGKSPNDVLRILVTTFCIFTAHII
jgi:hypothetical protein